MASSFGDLGRLINGVSLIAKEIAARSKALQSARTGDFQALVKAAVVSATDISGLTRGRVRELPSAGSTSPARPKESVVVFFEDQDTRRPETSSSVGGAAPEENAVSRDREAEVSAPRTSADVPGNSNRIDDQSVCLPDSRGRGDSGVPNESGETKDIEFSSLGEGREEVAVLPPKRRRPRERRVPSTPFSRALGFAGLGAGLAWGTIQESTKRLVYGTPKSQDKQSVLSPYLSEKNAERLALALCRMRGAALKIGQMLSIQDETLVPAPILAALDIVRQGADVMPRSQLNHVLDAEFGSDWSSKLTSFDYEPLAAASIGQVHRAVTKDGLEVAMKIQYPGVADSIESDIDNVKLLLNYTNLIPSGLYLDRAIKVAKEELSRECDYNLEATNQKRFRNLLSNAEGFYVPVVVENISSKRVITTELVTGIPIDKVALLSQETRDYVGKKLLELTLKELFIFRFMQTDPNWSNFLYDEVTRSINLIDFGAARDFPKSFVDDYFKMVIACANCDRDVVIQASQRMGFLTGEESEIMLEAHVQAGFIVGLPFSKPGGYDFRSTTITQSISNLGATMLKHRLTPPPDEAYSLHRKLAGAFLACIKLGAVVPCRELLLQVHEHYQFGEGDASILSGSPAS